eukprot:341970_1
MALFEDPQSDSSENAALLPHSKNTPSHMDENHQSFDVKYNTNNKLPSGKKFILKSDEIYGWTPRCKTCLCILLCISCVLFGTSWMMTENKFIGTIISYVALFCIFLFAIYLLSMIIVRIILYNKEQWFTYIMIINIEKDSFYIIDQSSRKRWEISSVGALNNFNISIKPDSKYKNKAFVMIDGTKFNTKCVRVKEAKHFIGLIENYLSDIYRNEYLNEQFMNGDQLAIINKNNNIKYDIDILNNNLTELIKRLMNCNDMNKVIDGERLNE